MTSGSINNSVPNLTKIVKQTGVPILSVDYTLPPSARAPVQDIEGYAGLNCPVENKAFEIDSERLG